MGQRAACRIELAKIVKCQGHPLRAESGTSPTSRRCLSMTGALKQRGVPDLTALVAAELGALALRIAYERWSDTTDGHGFSEVARRTIVELQAANALC